MATTQDLGPPHCHSERCPPWLGTPNSCRLWLSTGWRQPVGSNPRSSCETGAPGMLRAPLQPAAPIPKAPLPSPVPGVPPHLPVPSQPAPSSWAATHGNQDSKKSDLHQNKSYGFLHTRRKDRLPGLARAHSPADSPAWPPARHRRPPDPRHGQPVLVGCSWPWQGRSFALGMVARDRSRQWLGATEEQLGTTCASVHTSHPCRLPG